MMMANRVWFMATTITIPCGFAVELNGYSELTICVALISVGHRTDVAHDSRPAMVIPRAQRIGGHSHG